MTPKRLLSHLLHFPLTVLRRNTFRFDQILLIPNSSNSTRLRPRNTTQATKQATDVLNYFIYIKQFKTVRGSRKFLEEFNRKFCNFLKILGSKIKEKNRFLKDFLF